MRCRHPLHTALSVRIRRWVFVAAGLALAAACATTTPTQDPWNAARPIESSRVSTTEPSALASTGSVSSASPSDEHERDSAATSATESSRNAGSEPDTTPEASTAEGSDAESSATDDAAPSSQEGGADTDDDAQDATEQDSVGDDTQVLPPVTFPDASIRDPEAEAADLERRRSVIGLFERLRVEAEQRRGYDRDAVFGGWLYSNGRSTRDRVLAAERRPDGSWLSLYDNVSVTAATDLDIDHMVPLAEAWESGGHLWTSDTWTRYANDFDDPRSLIVVTASSNRSKSARDPAQWWPPEGSYQCQYAADWVAVKSCWDLAVDSLEQRALDNALDSCTGGEFDFSNPQPAATTPLRLP